MSFFKKIFAQDDMSPEEKERQEKEKAAKKAAREKQQQEWKEQRDREKAARKAMQEKEREMELEKTVKYFGPNPGVVAKTKFTLYKNPILYVESKVLALDETVLAAIPAEFDKTKKREMKGILVATSNRLIFATNGMGYGEYVESLDYQKMNGISLVADGFSKKELLIDYGRSRRVFDDIANDDMFKRFLEITRKKMHDSKRIEKPSRTTTRTVKKQEDKYETLARLGKLRDQGVLTDKEFESEKQKILNS